VQVVTQFLNLSYKEGMLLTPGRVFDLIYLEKQRRGINTEDD